MQIIEAGGLVFEVENRAFGKDGGPALMVFGEVDGNRVQLLRFDCFRTAPHYHYDPTGKNEQQKLDPGDDNVGWTVEQVRTRLDEMIQKAGYDALASQTDMEAVGAVADQIEAALRSEPETA